MMLANRLSPTTSRRRPTINPSSNHKNCHKNIIQNQIQSHWNCNEPILSKARRQNSSKTSIVEDEDGIARPPPSKSSSPSQIYDINTLMLSPLISSSPSAKPSNILENNRRQSDDQEAFYGNYSSTATFKNLETRSSRRLVHSTTRYVVMRTSFVIIFLVIEYYVHVTIFKYNLHCFCQ